MQESVRDVVCSYDNLYKAMNKCKNGVMWKDSTAGFVKNGLVNCFLLKDDLSSGKYRIGKYSVFTITEPKVRRIVSTRIRDRVFQRSLCDNYVTPTLSKSFIYDNAACQVGKGTDFARGRLKCHLQRFFRKNDLNGYVLKCDIKNYFGSTSHDVAKSAVADRLDDDWAFSEIERIIDSFDQGDDPNIGMGLGSQVTQLIELTVLDKLDHIIKERLRIKHYVRYMDDFLLIHNDKEYLKLCKNVIENEVKLLGLSMNNKKTQIFPIKQPIHFLGFSFRLTSTGKVVMRLLPEKVVRERRKLKKLVEFARQGVLTKDKVDSCFGCWVAHASKGNCYMLIERMTKFYESLWR